MGGGVIAGGQMWAQAAPYILFGTAALSSFAIGSLRGRRAAPRLIAGNGKIAMMTLMDAAAAVYETARRERMVIVTVAEKRPAKRPPTGSHKASPVSFRFINSAIRARSRSSTARALARNCNPCTYASATIKPMSAGRAPCSEAPSSRGDSGA